MGFIVNQPDRVHCKHIKCKPEEFEKHFNELIDILYKIKPKEEAIYSVFSMELSIEDISHDGENHYVTYRYYLK